MPSSGRLARNLPSVRGEVQDGEGETGVSSAVHLPQDFSAMTRFACRVSRQFLSGPFRRIVERVAGAAIGLAPL